MLVYFDTDLQKFNINGSYYPSNSLRFVFSVSDTKVAVMSISDNIEFLSATLITSLQNKSTVYYTNKADFLNQNSENLNQSGIDVKIQEQETPQFHRYFMTEEKTDIALTVAASKDDTILNVSAGHGITTNNHIIINYGDYTHQVKVTNVATNAITIETPTGIALPILGTQIIKGSIEMNVNGSVTPVTFYCRIGSNSRNVHLKHLHVFMTDATEGTDVLYGGATALTKGTSVRFETTDVGYNLGIYKKNQDFMQFGAHSGNYRTRVAGSDFGMDFPFDIVETYGTVFRLANDNYIKCTINDDLTVLTSHRLVATGHFVEN